MKTNDVVLSLKYFLIKAIISLLALQMTRPGYYGERAISSFFADLIVLSLVDSGTWRYNPRLTSASEML
jgi:hypothetical protein